MKFKFFLFTWCFLGMSQVAFAQEPLDSTDKSQVLIGEISEQPQFPGGLDAMFKFISDHLEYPKEAKDLAIEGNAVIQFVVNTDGSILDIKILKDPGGDLGKEAA